MHVAPASAHVLAGLHLKFLNRRMMRQSPLTHTLTIAHRHKSEHSAPCLPHVRAITTPGRAIERRCTSR